MAITFPDYILMRRLQQNGQIKPGCRLMEIGKQNWCADVPIDQLIFDTPDKKTAKGLKTIAKRDPNSFKIVDHYYRNVLGCSSVNSIDPGVEASSYKYDLNYPLWLKESPGEYDIVANSGTGEHIFNQAQLHQTMHDLTVQGGMITHALPWTGWHNHGFYNFHPTLVYDLAAANDYTVIDMVLGGAGVPMVFDMSDQGRWDYLVQELGTSKDGTFMFDGRPVRLLHTIIAVAFRKTSSKPFKIPNQGAYKGDLAKPAKRVRIKMNKAWRKA